MRRLNYFLFAICFCYLLLNGPAAAQDTTPEPVFDTATPTFAPTFTDTPTEVPTATVTPVPPTEIPPVTATIIPSETPTETSAEVTEAAIVLPSPPEATPEATATETLPIIPTDATPEITPGAATMEVTVIVTPEVTATESLPELTPEATAPAIVLRVVQGMVRYQNRQGGSDGIQVEVYTEDRATLVSAAQTDGEGRYTVQIPADAPYWLVASAPRYVTQAVLLSADTTPAPLILPGGDLDGDGCVGATDLALLTAQFDTRIAASDIDGDGVVEAADLAILSGNFDAGCRLIPTPPEPTIETTDNPVEATAVLTPTPTSAPPETATIEASVEITTAVTDTPEATPYTGGD